MLTRELTAADKALVGEVYERLLSWAAMWIGAVQFIDDGGSLIYQLSERVLYSRTGLAWLFLAVGAASYVMVVHLTQCKEMRALCMAMHYVMWAGVVVLYLISQAPRPIAAVACLFAGMAVHAGYRVLAHGRKR